MTLSKCNFLVAKYLMSTAVLFLEKSNCLMAWKGCIYEKMIEFSMMLPLTNFALKVRKVSFQVLVSVLRGLHEAGVWINLNLLQPLNWMCQRHIFFKNFVKNQYLIHNIHIIIKIKKIVPPMWCTCPGEKWRKFHY